MGDFFIVAYNEIRKLKRRHAMDNNLINNHICNNHNKRMERNYQTRMENEIMPRKEDNYDCEGNVLHNHTENYADNGNAFCNRCENRCKNEHGGEVYVFNVEKAAYKNKNFRESVWTGRELQMTLMSISRGQDIGVEIHKDTDQYIRVEHGIAILMTGHEQNCLEDKKKLCAGDAVFIPAGTWHNIVNVGRCDLKLSSVYAPPHHPKCTVEKYK